MEIEANKWLTLLAVTFTFFAGLVISVVFFIDPFLHYRNISNDKKLMEPRYSSIGIIKNFKHDMTILGMDSNNSMDMLYIRNYHERKPIQVGIDDSNLNEVLMLYTLAQENSNSDFYLMNVNAEDFLEDIEYNLTSSKFPDYLYNKSGLDDIKYLLNYEICFRYIPLNTIIDTAFKINKSLPLEMQEGTEIDKVVSWKKNSMPVVNLSKGNVKDFQIEGLTTNQIITDKEINKENSKKRIENRIDSFLDIIVKQLKEDQTLVFGFMPYSIKYWSNLSDNEFDTIMHAKEYFIKACGNRENIKIVDVQSMPEISDSTNYTKEQNLVEDFMKLYTDSIFVESRYVTSKLIDKNRSSLERQIHMFLEY